MGTGPRNRRARRCGLRWAAAALTTAAASLAAVASATAAPSIPHSLRHFDLPAATYLRAHANAANGYQLRLSAYSTEEPAQAGKPATTVSTVLLELAKSGGVAEYSSSDRRFVPDGTIEVEWGARGRVNAGFVPLHVDYEPVPWCEGSYTVESGLLVGTLRFHGEHGYASIRSHAVPATLYSRPQMRCHIPPSTKSHEGHESSSVGGSFARRGRQLGVTAEPHPALGTLTVTAYSAERRGGVFVTRRVSAVAPLTALEVEGEAETATLTAPSPFTGNAIYRAFPGKEAGTWRGDLSVDFPGEPGVRLAGKRFQGAKLKPGECAPDSGGSCISAKLVSPIAVKPAQSLR